MIFGLVALMVAMPAALGWAQDDDMDGPNIGGDVRIRTEAKGPFDYIRGTGDPAGDDGTFMRSRFHLDWALANNIGVFLEIQDSRTFGTDSVFDEADPDLDMKQAYVSLNNLQEMESLNFLGDNDVDFMVGRIVLPTLGDGYIVASDPWSNSGPTAWDGFWFDSSFGSEDFAVDVDFLWADLANNDPYATGGGGPVGAGEGAVFWGLQAGTDSLPFVGGEVYFWNYSGDVASLGFTDTNIQIFGIRLTDNLPEGTLDGLDLVFEYAMQSGEASATVDQDASFFLFRAAYEIPVDGLNPKVGAGFSSASGSSATATDNETWISPLEDSHALLGHYDLTSNSNVNDFFVTGQVTLVDAIDVHADLHFLTLNEEADGWYTVYAGNGGAVADDDLGTEIDLYASWDCGPSLAFQAGWSMFMPGKAVEQSTPSGTFDDTGNFFYLQMTVPFGAQAN
jgi:PKD repeat protein